MAEDYSLLDQEVQKDFKEWFGDLGPADVQFPAEANPSNHRTLRRRVDNLHIILELLNFSFGGAVFLGAGVSIIITCLSFLERYSNNWPDPIVVIFLAMVIGFISGLCRGLLYKLREQILYKD